MLASKVDSEWQALARDTFLEDRITSYNVCYTKLLRQSSSRRSPMKKYSPATSIGAAPVSCAAWMMPRAV